MDRDRFYKTMTWQSKREYILSRDKYLCQQCLKNKILTPADTVHHKMFLEYRPDLALEDDNLMSVCRYCHEQIHKRVQRMLEGRAKFRRTPKTPSGVRVIRM